MMDRSIDDVARETVDVLYALARTFDRSRSVEDRDNLRGAILCLDVEDGDGESLLLEFGGPTSWIHLHQDGTGTYHDTGLVRDGDSWREQSCSLSVRQTRQAGLVASVYRVADRAAAADLVS